LHRLSTYSTIVLYNTTTLYCTLYTTILYTIHYYTVLYTTILYYNTIHYTLLCCTVLYYTVYSILCSYTIHYYILYYTIILYTIHCTLLHSIQCRKLADTSSFGYIKKINFVHLSVIVILSTLLIQLSSTCIASVSVEGIPPPDYIATPDEDPTLQVPPVIHYDDWRGSAGRIKKQQGKMLCRILASNVCPAQQHCFLHTSFCTPLSAQKP